jgi:hypothetical protein
VTNVKEDGDDVLMSLKSGGTITLEGIADGAIDDMNDLYDRDYNIIFS